MILLAAAWLGLRLYQAARQRSAVEEIRKLGGRVLYGCRYTESGTLHTMGIPGPRWLQELLGADFLAEADGVLLTEACDLEGLADFDMFRRPLPKLTDADFRHLEILNGLDWVALSGTPIGDAGLVNLKNLAELRRLWLCDARLTDAGMKHIGNLQGLEALWLDDNHVTDAGLKRVAPLSRLELLSLSRTRVSDAGLQSLKGMTGLHTLRLDGTDCTFSGAVHLFTELQNRPLADALRAVARTKLDDQGEVLTLDLSRIRTTDAGLARLEPLSRLEWLFLTHAPVTDAGLAHLKGLTNLTLLDLSGTQVTDRGLKHLHGLAKLRTLHLGDTQVTDSGVERLKANLPQRIRIYRLPPRPKD